MSLEGKRIYTKLFAEPFVRLYIVLISFLVLLLPHILRLKRFGKDLLIGRQAYFLLRLINLKDFDSLSSGGKYFFALRGTSKLIDFFNVLTGINVEKLALYLPIVFGLLSSILFYNLIRKHIDFNKSAFVTLLYVVSPIFIFTFATLNPYFVLVLITLTILNLLHTKFSYLSLPLFLLVPFFDFISTFFVLLIIYSYAFTFKKELSRQVAPFSLFVVLESSLYYLSAFLNYGFPYFQFRFNIQNWFSDFGSLLGFSTFLLLLVFLTVFTNLKSKYRFSLFSLAFLLIIFFSFFYSPLNLFIAPLFALIAYIGFKMLDSMKWEVELVKLFTIFILFLGILFSTLSYASYISTYPPSVEMQTSLKFLKDVSTKDSIVLSDYNNGEWINYFANRKTFLTSFDYVSDLDKRLNASKELYQSRDEKKVIDLLSQYNISYIFIDKTMLENIWTSDEQGLLFLLKYSKNFNRVYYSNNIGIWRVNYASN